MENAAGIGTVTSEMVEARARELAAINGHPSKPSEADYQQAKRELTGETETRRGFARGKRTARASYGSGSSLFSSARDA